MYLLQAALSFTIGDLINPDHKKSCFISYFTTNPVRVLNTDRIGKIAVL
jgi:hypothetical protein